MWRAGQGPRPGLAPHLHAILVATCRNDDRRVFHDLSEEHVGKSERLRRVNTKYELVLAKKIRAMDDTVKILVPLALDGLEYAREKGDEGAVGSLDFSPDFFSNLAHWFQMSSGGSSETGVPLRQAA